MKNLRARTLWILTVVVLLISVGLIFACVYTTDWLNKMMIVLMAISFLSFTFLVQLATAKSIKPKVRKKNYISKVYNNEFSLRNRLGENGFKKHERAYGDSYLLIKDLKAYKVVLVDINDSKVESQCNLVISLLEPSTLKLNKMLKRDPKILEKIRERSWCYIL